MEKEINRAELKKFLKEQGFEDINNDDVFETNHICVHVDAEGKKGISIAFGHSNNGYNNIENPTFEQIKRVVSVFKESKFIEIENNYKTVKEQYGFLILNDFKSYLEK